MAETDVTRHGAASTNGKKPCGKRLPIEELERRVDEVVVLILTGVRRAAILRHVAENTLWDVSERTVENYIAKARDRIKDETASDHKQLRATAHARLELVYRRSLEAKDFNAARKTLEAISRLYGLEAPKQMRIAATVENVTPQRPPTLEHRAATAASFITLARQRERDALGKRIAASN